MIRYLWLVFCPFVMATGGAFLSAQEDSSEWLPLDSDWGMRVGTDFECRFTVYQPGENPERAQMAPSRIDAMAVDLSVPGMADALKARPPGLRRLAVHWEVDAPDMPAVLASLLADESMSRLVEVRLELTGCFADRDASGEVVEALKGLQGLHTLSLYIRDEAAMTFFDRLPELQLRALAVDWFSPVPTSKQSERLFRTFGQMRGLERLGYSAYGIDELRALKPLRSSLKWLSVGIDTFAPPAPEPEEEQRLARFMRELATFRQLEALTVRGCEAPSLSPAIAEPWKELTSLRKLCLWDVERVEDDGAVSRVIAGLPNLTHFWLVGDSGGTGKTAADFAALATSRSLTHVRVSGIGEPSHVSALAELETLEVLDVGFANTAYESEPFRGHPNLRRHTGIDGVFATTPFNLDVIADIPNFEEIGSFSGYDWESDEYATLEDVRRLPSVKALGITASDGQDPRAIEDLLSRGTLIYLSIEHADELPLDLWVRGIAANPNLQWLTLRGDYSVEFVEALLPVLAHMHNLRAFDGLPKDEEFLERAIEHLQRFRNLRLLGISLDEERRSALRDALPGCNIS